MSKTVRIESTRHNMVCLPPTGMSDGDRVKGIPHFEARQIPKAATNDQNQVTHPSVTVIPAEYWKLIKERPDVQKLFAPIDGVMGQLRLIDGMDAGPVKDASAPDVLPANSAEALVIINACTDFDRLMKWASDMPASAEDTLRAALSARIAVVESAAKRGEGDQGEASQPG